MEMDGQPIRELSGSLKMLGEVWGLGMRIGRIAALQEVMCFIVTRSTGEMCEVSRCCVPWVVGGSRTDMLVGCGSSSST